MTRVAVICAYPEKLNAGMLTVDLAAPVFIQRILQAAGLHEDAAVEFFTVEDSLHPDPNDILKYRFLKDPRTLNADHDLIAYWGDFLHNLSYVEMVGRRYGIKNEISESEAMNHAYAALLMEGLPDEMLAKTVCIGGALHLNCFRAETHSRYQKAIKRLYSRAAVVVSREPNSTYFARYYSSRANVVATGLDCSFFFDPGMLSQLCTRRTSASVSPIVGFSFGRKLSKNRRSRKNMHSFVDAIARCHAAEQLLDVAWLTPDYVDPLLELARKIEAIRACDVVVTDTYHCAINCIREGIPVVCVGGGEAGPRSTVGEIKKQFLYLALNIPELYVLAERLVTRKSRREQARTVSQLLSDRRIISALTQRMRVNQDTIVSDVAAALEGVLTETCES